MQYPKDGWGVGIQLKGSVSKRGGSWLFPSSIGCVGLQTRNVVFRFWLVSKLTEVNR